MRGERSILLVQSNKTVVTQKKVRLLKKNTRILRSPYGEAVVKKSTLSERYERFKKHLKGHENSHNLSTSNL